jgi:hypothetical protein
MDMNIIKSLIAGTLFGFGLLVSAQTNAAPVMFDLYLNNVYTTDPTKAYVTVTIEEGVSSDPDDGNDHTGDIKFTVDPDQSLFAAPGGTFTNFGIQSAGFNIDPSLTIDGVGISFLNPDQWSFDASGTASQDGWGDYDLVVSGKGNNRQDPLVFWVTGVTGDAPESYYYPTLDNGGIERYFATHVMDIDTGVFAWRTDGDGEDCNEGDPDCSYQLLTSAYFTTPVPVPAAIWLFGSGLLGLAGIARRRKV